MMNLTHGPRTNTVHGNDPYFLTLKRVVNCTPSGKVGQRSILITWTRTSTKCH